MLLRVNERNALCRFSFCFLKNLNCCDVQLGERFLPDHVHGLTEGLLGQGDEVNLLTWDSVLLGGVTTDLRLQQAHQHLDGVLPAVEIILKTSRMRIHQKYFDKQKKSRRIV